MNLEDQVCSLDSAKRLKELGVKQESLWWWCLPPMNIKTELLFRGIYHMYSPAEGTSFKKSTFGDDTNWYSAFTIAELGEMLPKVYITWRDTLVGDEWWLCDDRTKGSTDTYQYAKTEADVRAKMLVYLLENKLITV